jgi:pullulanase/glycogen debranching enzyme
MPKYPSRAKTPATGPNNSEETLTTVVKNIDFNTITDNTNNMYDNAVKDFKTQVYGSENSLIKAIEAYNIYVLSNKDTAAISAVKLAISSAYLTLSLSENKLAITETPEEVHNYLQFVYDAYQQKHTEAISTFNKLKSKQPSE